MEPFAIQCPTCQSRLRVRSPEAIGQIVRCPRCGGMVMIQPPVPGGEADVAGDRAGGRPASGAQPGSGRSLPAAAALERSFDRINDLLADPEYPDPETLAQHHPDLGANPEVPPDSDESFVAAAGAVPLPPAGDWASSDARTYRSWLMWGMIGMVSVGAVAGAAIQYIGGREGETIAGVDSAADPLTQTPDSTAPVNSPAPPVTSAPPETPSPETPTPDQPPLSDAPDAAANPPSEVVGGAVDMSHGDPASNADALAAEAPETTTAAVDAGRDDAGRDDESDSAVSSAGEEPNDEVEEPEEEANGSVPDAFVAPRRGEAVRDLFREMANLSSDDSQPEQMPSTTLEPTDATDATGEDAPVSILNEEPGYVLPSDRDRPPIRQHHLASRMNDPVAQIQLVDLPLRDFLVFFTEFTTIPVTVPADVILQNQLSAQQTVSVKSKGLTAEQVLKQALQPLHVMPDISSGHLVLRTHTDAAHGLRSAEYSVESLMRAGGEKSSRRLADECMRLTGASNWSLSDGPCELDVAGDVWKVRATESVHFQLEYVLDSMRHSHGLPRQAHYPERWYARHSRSRRAQPLLQTPITMRSIRWSPLYQNVEELARRADCELFVDWEALAAAGWAHDEPVSVNIENQPLAEGLSKMLRPMSLVYRVVDDRTLQITTREAEAQQYELETYNLAERMDQGRTAAQIQQDILQLVGLREFYAGGGLGHLYVDPAGKVAIVRLPQSYQLVVDRYLSTP